MTRKDSEKDADRPHYYSQFWLDIAAGRRVIGGPKPDEAEENEADIPEPVLTPMRKAGRSTADAFKETRASAVAEPEVEEEEELEQEDTVEEGDIPTIVFDEDAEPAADVVEGGFNEEEPELAEDEELFEEEEEEEEEDEEGEWGRRGGARKKAKPVRPTKPVKKPKREIRRNF